MILDRFFINDIVLNWDYINTIPEFAKLADCEQNPVWHGEGNALAHTKKCVQVACDSAYMYADDLQDKRMIIIAVLLHDIGKSCTTEFKNGNWHAYGHEFAGEKIARRILWDEEIEVRERICNAIRHHMEPLRIADAKGGDLFKKLITPMFNPFFRWRDVLFVKYCDILGSKPSNEDETQIAISKLHTMEQYAFMLDLYNKKLCYGEESYKSFVLGKKVYWLRKLEPKMHYVYVMIGMPGSGKNAWITRNFIIDKEQNNDSVVVLSRDDIRAELGYCNEGDKVVLSKEKEEEVTKVFYDRFIDAIMADKVVVLNNINLKKQYRDDYVKFLAEHHINNVEWHYVYVEADNMETLLLRRPTFSKKIYENLIEKFDFPQPGEYDKFCIVKQMKNGEDRFIF